MNRNCFISLLVVLVVLSCMSDPDTPKGVSTDIILTVEYDSNNMSRSSVALIGTISDSLHFAHYGFEIAEKSFAQGVGHSFEARVIKGNRFESEASILPGKLYAIRSWCSSGDYKFYSPVKYFSSPSSSCASLADVHLENDVLVSEVLDNGGRQINDVGFILGETPNISEIKRSEMITATNVTNNSFSLDLSYLLPGKNYFVISFAENSDQPECKEYGFSKTYTEVFRKGISFKSDVLSMRVGDNYTLAVTMVIDNKQLSDVLWRSNDESVAKVSSSGGVTAVSPGTCNITAQVGVYMAVCSVTVHSVFYGNGVPIDSICFPDSAFRSFVADNFDKDGNGSLSIDERNAVTKIDVQGIGITSLSGLEFFDYLKELNCTNNSIGLLDLNQNHCLVSLICGNNRLKHLNILFNPEIETIICYGNNLEGELFLNDLSKLRYLDVSNNPELVTLYCYLCDLRSLDAHSNTAMKKLNCAGNILTSLDIRGNMALRELSCADNKLTSLDVRSNEALWFLSCSNNDLTSLDVRSNSALLDLFCENNKLTSLDVRSNRVLRTLSCGGNNLTSLDVSGNTALQGFSCFNNNLTSLDVSSNTALKSLTCYNNNLISLDVSSNTALQNLNCDSNNLTSLDVSSNTALQTINCYDNKLTSLDVRFNTALQTLNCGGNSLTSLDVGGNTALQSLYCGSNDLTSLDVSSNVALRSLYCGSNDLTSLDVSYNTELSELRLDYNLLTILDVSSNAKLRYLSCLLNPYLKEIWLKKGQLISTFWYDTSVATIKYKD